MLNIDGIMRLRYVKLFSDQKLSIYIFRVQSENNFPRFLATQTLFWFRGFWYLIDRVKNQVLYYLRTSAVSQKSITKINIPEIVLLTRLFARSLRSVFFHG